MAPVWLDSDKKLQHHLTPQEVLNFFAGSDANALNLLPLAPNDDFLLALSFDV